MSFTVPVLKAIESAQNLLLGIASFSKQNEGYHLVVSILILIKETHKNFEQCKSTKETSL